MPITERYYLTTGTWQSGLVRDINTNFPDILNTKVEVQKIMAYSMPY